MKVKCPRCGRPTNFDKSNVDRPFCGERCRTIDLGAWADESYRVPDRDVDPSGVNENEADPDPETETSSRKPNLN